MVSETISIEEMRQELESNGYEYAPRNTFTHPNGRTFFDGVNLEHSIELAYEDLQKERKVAALSSFVWDMWYTAKRMRGTEPSLTIFNKADNLIAKYNLSNPDAPEDNDAQ